MRNRDAGLCQGFTAEIIVIDNGSTDDTAEWLEEYQSLDPDFQVIHCDHVIGDAAGKNIGLKLSRGKHIVILDASTELTGDVLGPIARQLSDESVGIFGPYGLTTDDMQHFHEEGGKGRGRTRCRRTAWPSGGRRSTRSA